MSYKTLTEQLQELIGLKVEKISIGTNDEYMKLDTDKGLIGFETYGDCCSFTWFAEIINTKALIGNIVIEARELQHSELPQRLQKLNQIDDGNSRDSDIAHGIEITTIAGKTQIIYRNSSNGYYDGGIGKASWADASAMVRTTWNNEKRCRETLPIVWEEIVEEWDAYDNNKDI